MAKRSKMTKKGNRRLFKRGLKTEGRNVAPPPLRGGYRM